MKQVKDVRKYESLGEVKGGSFTLFKINGRVVFSNGEYFYTYEDMTDSIVPYETMNEQLMELKGIKTVSHANGDYYWFVGDRTVYLVKCAINTFNIELPVLKQIVPRYINLRLGVLYGFQRCRLLRNSVINGKHWSCSRESRSNMSLIQ